ncbi:hypothetical protein [Corynebacterium sp. 045007]
MTAVVCTELLDEADKALVEDAATLLAHLDVTSLLYAAVKTESA